MVGHGRTQSQIHISPKSARSPTLHPRACKPLPLSSRTQSFLWLPLASHDRWSIHRCPAVHDLSSEAFAQCPCLLPTSFCSRHSSTLVLTHPLGSVLGAVFLALALAHQPVPLLRLVLRNTVSRQTKPQDSRSDGGDALVGSCHGCLLSLHPSNPCVSRAGAKCLAIHCSEREAPPNRHARWLNKTRVLIGRTRAPLLGTG